MRGNKKKNVDLKIRKMGFNPVVEWATLQNISKSEEPIKEHDIENYYISFLKKNNYVSDMDLLTEKGKHAQSISECCDVVILTEIIYNSIILKDLAFPEICAVLATLIEDKTNNNEPINILLWADSTNIITSRIGKIKQLMQTCQYDGEIWPDSLFAQIIFLWAQQDIVINYKDLRMHAVTAFEKFCEGTFIKNVLKITGILEKCLAIYETVDMAIYNIMKDYRQILIRSICIPESLFVKVL